MDSLRCSLRKHLLRPLAFFSLAIAAHLASPSPALSTPPTPANSTVPAQIPVVGHDAVGTADPIGEVLVVIRDIANTPVPGAVVTIDFSSCTDLRLCADPHDPDAVLNCADRTISKVTGLNGQVRFRVVGCSVRAAGAPGNPPNCARIYSDGVLVGSPSVAIYDLQGCDGVGAPDLSAFLDDFFGGYDPSGADYNNTGVPLDAGDLSLWLTLFFGAGSLFNCSNGSPCGP